MTPLLSGALESRGVVKDWVKWFRADEYPARVETIRASTRTGRPASDEAFVARIEKLSGWTLRFEKRKAGGEAKG
jgi:hypothetical protein